MTDFQIIIIESGSTKIEADFALGIEEAPPKRCFLLNWVLSDKLVRRVGQRRIFWKEVWKASRSEVYDLSGKRAGVWKKDVRIKHWKFFPCLSWTCYCSDKKFGEGAGWRYEQHSTNVDTGNIIE